MLYRPLPHARVAVKDASAASKTRHRSQETHRRTGISEKKRFGRFMQRTPRADHPETAAARFHLRSESAQTVGHVPRIIAYCRFTQ
jgi:hypothetical protein